MVEELTALTIEKTTQRIIAIVGRKACVYYPHRPLPDDAPQAVKDFAAQHWTPEVIQFAKDRLAGVRPKEG